VDVNLNLKLVADERKLGCNDYNGQ